MDGGGLFEMIQLICSTYKKNPTIERNYLFSDATITERKKYPGQNDGKNRFRVKFKKKSNSLGSRVMF